MATRFPDKICIRFVDTDKREPVAGLVCKLTLFAAAKNNYYVGPKITDALGQVCFMLGELVQMIELSWRLSGMDYQSPLEDCSSTVEIRTLAYQEIGPMIKTNKEWGVNVPEFLFTAGFVSQLRKSSNKRYIPVHKQLDVAGIKDGDVFDVEVQPER